MDGPGPPIHTKTATTATSCATTRASLDFTNETSAPAGPIVSPKRPTEPSLR
jgi:hypothetical protein